MDTVSTSLLPKKRIKRLCFNRPSYEFLPSHEQHKLLNIPKTFFIHGSAYVFLKLAYYSTMLQNRLKTTKTRMGKPELDGHNFTPSVFLMANGCIKRLRWYRPTFAFLQREIINLSKVPFMDDNAYISSKYTYYSEMPQNRLRMVNTSIIHPELDKTKTKNTFFKTIPISL
jgi:hypothetical protein